MVFADDADPARASAPVVIKMLNLNVVDPKEFATARAEVLVRVRGMLKTEIRATTENEVVEKHKSDRGREFSKVGRG